MTWSAVKERIQHIWQGEDPLARANELMRVYGLTFAHLSLCWGAKGQRSTPFPPGPSH